MSLMEMILVLAVIVAIAAIAIPVLQGPMDDQRLRKTGDLIQAQWSKARATAMKTGRMHIFHYQIGGDMYRLEPWLDDIDALEATATGTLTPAPELGPQINPRDLASSLGITGAKLPDGVTFVGGQSLIDSRMASVGDGQLAAAADGGWAPPIVFYPDGSASDARVTLTNQRFFIEVKLRGLTGIARASDLLTFEELSP